MKRTQFFGNQLAYLLSFDLPVAAPVILGPATKDAELAMDRAEPIASVRFHRFDESARAVRKSVRADTAADQILAPRVYNALAERRVLGEEPVTGRLRVLQEQLVLHPADEMGHIEGRMLIDTDDGVVIESTYKGVVRAGARWHWIAQGGSDYQARGRHNGRMDEAYSHASSRSDAGSAHKPGAVEMKAFISARFDSGHSKYKWLVGYQCVGYGRLHVLEATPTWGTFDVYAMTGGAGATER